MWTNQNSSSSRQKVLLLFVDDYPRMMWAIFIKFKSKAFECFNNFKGLVENEKESKIKCLRTYRGGEFPSMEFDDFCKVHGIKRELSIGGTPKQNGLVERRKKILQEMERTVLLAVDLQGKFWREVVGTTIYTLNRTQIIPNNDKTPYELWKGRPASVKEDYILKEPKNQQRKKNLKKFKKNHLKLQR